MSIRLRLMGVVEPVVARVEKELNVKIMWDVLGDQADGKYTFLIAGEKPLRFGLRDTAPDETIAASVYARVSEHFSRTKTPRGT